MGRLARSFRFHRGLRDNVEWTLLNMHFQEGQLIRFYEILRSGGVGDDGDDPEFCQTTLFVWLNTAVGEKLQHT